MLLQFDCRLRYDSGFELNARFETDGGVTALSGPSGSGKTTVLGLIAGILTPDKGAIRLGETVLVDTAASVCRPPERRRVGIVFQDHRLFPHLTVQDNLLFGKDRQGARPIDFRKAVECMEIGPLLKRFPATLSGGQKQRVALGRALLRGPELLLMDEPLAALDMELKDRILTYLERAVAEWNIPTLFVSHDTEDVRRFTTRTIALDKGQAIKS